MNNCCIGGVIHLGGVGPCSFMGRVTPVYTSQPAVPVPTAGHGNRNSWNLTPRKDTLSLEVTTESLNTHGPCYGSYSVWGALCPQSMDPEALVDWKSKLGRGI